MTFFDYFRMIIRNKFLILLVVLICTAGAYLYTANFNNNPYQSTLFLSFGIQDKNLNATTSSFENLEAADQITESIQGWFKDPGFLNQIAQKSQLNYPIQAKKQEKNNLIIQFNSSDLLTAQKYSDQITTSLNERLIQYNAKSDLQINIATSTLDSGKSGSKTSLYLLLALLIGSIAGFFGALFWEILIHVVQSNQQLEDLAQQKLLASYRNENSFKKNYYFLCQFLNQKYSGQPLQIIDLTHKSNFGLETISKNTDLAQLKSLKLPADFAKLSPTAPTLVIVEIGYSKAKLIKEIIKFDLVNLEIIALQKIYR